ncbi:hypothetical protein EPN16_04575 [bacterium]|nr:MAG: hypothetical protein EPN16_04575 [bacterium]
MKNPPSGFKHWLFLCFSLIAIIAFCARPLAVHFVKQYLKNIFPASAVSIGACGIRPLSLIAFSDVEIRDGGRFGIKLKQADIRYRPVSLLKGNVFLFFQGLDCDFGKLRLRGCRGRVAFRPGRADLDLSSCDIFGGKISGSAELGLNGSLAYSSELSLSGINPDDFIKDFELGEKFRMSGNLSGAVRIEGKGDGLEILNGSLLAAQPGGTLVITDRSFLENISRASGQSFEMLVESFRNYRYNTGILKLSLDKGNLIFDITLDGEAGRRKLDIVAHDFSLRGLMPGGSGLKPEERS